MLTDYRYYKNPAMSALPQHEWWQPKMVENLAALLWQVYKRYSQLQLTQINRGIVWLRNTTNKDRS